MERPVQSVAGNYGSQNKLCMHLCSVNMHQTRQTQKQHRNAYTLFTVQIPANYRNYLNSGGASKASAFHHSYIIDQKYLNTFNNI